jgi:hypothetical protein
MGEIMHQLGIEPATIVVEMVGFVLLLVLLKRFLWSPVTAIWSSARETSRRRTIRSSKPVRRWSDCATSTNSV